MTSGDRADPPHGSVKYLVLLWFSFSVLDALWLAGWWIETTPQTDLLLGRFPRLKFVLLRAMVIKPTLGLVAVFTYGPVLGAFMPHRASLDDMCLLSFNIFDLQKFVNLLWSAPSVSFWTIWQTALSVLITTWLMLWFDGNYCFAYFVNPSQQTLKHLNLWLKLPRKKLD